jgi:hypothetical protein
LRSSAAPKNDRHLYVSDNPGLSSMTLRFSAAPEGDRHPE